MFETSLQVQMGGALIRLAASRRYADDSFAKKIEVENRQTPVDFAEDQRYRTLAVEKEFSGGYCANSVALLKGGTVVKKQYDLNTEPGRLFFWHELGILQKLKGCPYVPRVLHFDRDNGVIYMSYCGKSGVKNSPRVQKQLQFQLKEMRDKWGVSRTDGLHPRLLGENAYGFELNNVTRQGKDLFFIDFGGYKWSYHKPKAKPHKNANARKTTPTSQHPENQTIHTSQAEDPPAAAIKSHLADQPGFGSAKRLARSVANGSAASVSAADPSEATHGHWKRNPAAIAVPSRHVA